MAVFLTKPKSLPKQNGGAVAAARNQQHKVAGSGKAKPTGLKPKDFCRKFNAEGCSRTAEECRYKHEKATPAVIQREYEQSQIRQAAHFASLTVKSPTASADFSNIKSSSYSCSYSSNLPTTNMILDTGASTTMSSERNLFTNLTTSKNSIHIANKDIIYSTHIGTFHLHTKLDNGKAITISLPDSLYVPQLRRSRTAQR